MRLILITAFLLILAPLGVFSQSKDCQGVCISQQAANAAAELARENPLLKEKIAVLEQALADKDKIFADFKAVKDQNESDLKRALSATEVKLAEKTGEVIQLEADRVRWSAVIDVLVKNSRQKKVGLINLF